MKERRQVDNSGPGVGTLLDYRQKLPIRDLSSWRGLESHIGWLDPFTAKGTEVQRVDWHSQGDTRKGREELGCSHPTQQQGGRKRWESEVCQIGWWADR